MQAQVPLDPYTGLWSRLERLRPEELARLLEERRAVRIAAMRATIHLVSADDCLVLRPLMQPVLDAEIARHPEFAPLLRGVDLAPVLAFARGCYAERPRTGPRAARRARAAVPGQRCAGARLRVPLQARVRAGAAARRLGRVRAGRRTRPPRRGSAARSPRDRRSTPSCCATSRAFGPASVADVTTWSRLTGLREVVERLRPQLRTFRDERGRELFDLPDAPRPDPDTPAPPRFLPEYDNVLLSHADRSRVVPRGDAPRACQARAASGTARCSTTASSAASGGSSATAPRPSRSVTHAG